MLAREDREQILRLHRNAQRLLKPVRVVNRYAPSLTFLDGRTRTRRDHAKYLTLIRTIALVHQHQRPRKTHQHGGRAIEYIEVTQADIALANELAHEVLGRPLDELAPQTRRLLELIEREVTRECAVRAVARCDYRFSNRDVRAWSGWSDFQVRTHVHKLIAMEYILVHRGGRGQSFVYELLYDGGGRDGRPFMMGLIDPAGLKLQDNYEHPPTNNEHRKAENEAGASPERASNEHGSSDAAVAPNSSLGGKLPRTRRYKLENGHQGNDRQPHASQPVGVAGKG